MNKPALFGRDSPFSFGKEGSLRTFWEHSRANGSLVRCKEQEKSRRITASNLEMETKPAFLEEVSSDIL
jgi:hypothetical protein